MACDWRRIRVMDIKKLSLGNGFSIHTRPHFCVSLCLALLAKLASHVSCVCIRNDRQQDP